MKVVRLSALRTGRLYPPRKYSWYSSLLEAESTPGHLAMKNSNDTIGNRTRDLPACSAVPQPTAPPRAPTVWVTSQYPEQNNKYVRIFRSALQRRTLPVICSKLRTFLIHAMNISQPRSTVIYTKGSNWGDDGKRCRGVAREYYITT
jgi:hypothetical protein